jgi:hypothetical protein
MGNGELDSGDITHQTEIPGIAILLLGIFISIFTIFAVANMESKETKLKCTEVSTKISVCIDGPFFKNPGNNTNDFTLRKYN